MYTQLLEDSIRKHYLQEVNVFDAPEGEGEWKCPFCDPKTSIYGLKLPTSEDPKRLKHVRKLIREHLELHKLNVLDQLKDRHEYDKSKVESIKRVHLWISGTISDRQLYEDDPF